MGFKIEDPSLLSCCSFPLLSAILCSLVFLILQQCTKALNLICQITVPETDAEHLNLIIQH